MHSLLTFPWIVTEETPLKAGDTSSSEIKEAKCVQMLKAGHTFSNPKALMDTIDGVFTSTGALKSSMCRKTKESFGPDQEMEIFGYVYGVGGKNKKTGKTTSPKRGRCYCSVEGCNWNVAFTFSSKTNSYVIKDEDFDADSDFKCHFLLEHNHPIENEILDGYVLITCQSDLTEEEMNTLKSLAITHSQMPSIQHVMMNEYSKGSRAFSDDLLYRVVTKIRDEKFGSDRHRMEEFIEMGRKAIALLR